MRVLHVVKTSEGAQWAAKQAKVLSTLGVDVHVALPSLSGRAVAPWQEAGATLHVADLSLPVRSPQKLPSVLNTIRRLVQAVDPDIIHSHFVTTTCTIRMALRKSHRVPRVYQVAGPLHLEHWFSRTLEVSLANEEDYWIGSSRCIVDWYRRIGISPERVFLSYYGWFKTQERTQTLGGELRRLVQASDNDIIVGNVNFMYAPKLYLGQTVGLKCHEDVIDALGEIVRRRPEVLGVFVGGAWGDANWYEQKLRKRAWALAKDRIRFSGPIPFEKAQCIWADFDVAVHVPFSENCGGVLEPLALGVPVIASKVGGLPEVVIHGKTGWLVPPRQPKSVTEKIIEVIDNIHQARRMAGLGQQLVRTMFDADRTGREVYAIYEHLLNPSKNPPEPFHSEKFIESIMRSQ